MKQLTCVAIDDEPLALDLISEYISKLPVLNLKEAFEDAISGSEYLKQHQIDLLFVDINMPDISGIDLVRSLPQKPMIIFITAYRNFAVEGFELQAVDYILKPIEFDRFKQAVEKAVDFQAYRLAADKNQQQESLYVYSEYRMIKIVVDEIEYIESMEDYIKIHLVDHPKPVLTLMTMKKVLEKLPQEGFTRIHRSYIVRDQYIKSIHNRKVQLKSIELPLGASYTDILTKWSR